MGWEWGWGGKGGGGDWVGIRPPRLHDYATAALRLLLAYSHIIAGGLVSKRMGVGPGKTGVASKCERSRGGCLGKRPEPDS